MPVSPCGTVGLSVRLTDFASAPAAVALTVVAVAVPATLKGAGPGLDNGSSGSSKVRVSVVPFTVAVCSVGAVVSPLVELVTSLPEKSATSLSEVSLSGFASLPFA